MNPLGTCDNITAAIPALRGAGDEAGTLVGTMVDDADGVGEMVGRFTFRPNSWEYPTGAAPRMEHAYGNTAQGPALLVDTAGLQPWERADVLHYAVGTRVEASGGAAHVAWYTGDDKFKIMEVARRDGLGAIAPYGAYKQTPIAPIAHHPIEVIGVGTPDGGAIMSTPRIARPQTAPF